MWIRRKHYKELKQAVIDKAILQTEIDIWKAKYDALDQEKLSIIRDSKGQSIVVIPFDQLQQNHAEGDRAIEVLKQLKPELLKYKKLYADEVQKRIDLIAKLPAVEINVGGMKDEVQ